MLPGILSIDLGTYCDNALAMTVLSDFVEDHTIYVVADEKHEVSKHKNIQKIPYKTPAFILEDESMDLADPHQSMVLWALTNPHRAYETAKWSSVMKTKVEETLRKHKHIKTIIALYPAFPVIARIKEELLANVQVYIVYYAPGIPNKSIPWLFDSVYRDKGFKIYKTTAEDNLKSTLSYMQRIATFTGQRLSTLLEKFASFHHVLAWDPKVLRNDVKPFIHESVKLKVYCTGAILKKNDGAPIPLSPLLECVLKTYKKLIFMSFGSYANNAYLRNVLPPLLKLLEDCAVEQGYHVIFHNGHYHSRHITSINGFIPYESVIAHCSLVVFTGSVCLQNICLLQQVPMLFVPVLAEQHFWAHNYKFCTGISPIQPDKVIKKHHIYTAMKSMKVKHYLKNVSSSMKSMRHIESLRKIVTG